MMTQKPQGVFLPKEALGDTVSLLLVPETLCPRGPTLTQGPARCTFIPLCPGQPWKP